MAHTDRHACGELPVEYVSLTVWHCPTHGVWTIQLAGWTDDVPAQHEAIVEEEWGDLLKDDRIRAIIEHDLALALERRLGLRPF